MFFAGNPGDQGGERRIGYLNNFLIRTFIRCGPGCLQKDGLTSFVGCPLDFSKITLLNNAMFVCLLQVVLAMSQNDVVDASIEEESEEYVIDSSLIVQSTPRKNVGECKAVFNFPFLCDS